MTEAGSTEMQADREAAWAAELLAAARAVAARAYAPYSRFLVGAAVRGGSGRIFSGCNVENASYPVGTCAEAGAIAALIAAGERRITAALVFGDAAEPLVPCGACRQRLSEFGAAIVPVWSAGPDGLRGRWMLGELLPLAFRLDAPAAEDDAR